MGTDGERRTERFSHEKHEEHKKQRCGGATQNWVSDGGEIRGKWVEVIADRASHKYTGRLEISFRITVNGDTFVGTESVRAFDAAGNSAEAPLTPGQLQGKRVTIP